MQRDKNSDSAQPLRMLVVPAENHPSDHSFLEEVHTRDASRVERTFFMRSTQAVHAQEGRWNRAKLDLLPLRSSNAIVAGLAVYFLDLRYIPHLWRVARRERPHAVYIRDLTYPLLFALLMRPWWHWKVVYQRSFPHEFGWFDPQRVNQYRLPWLYTLARQVELPLLRWLLGVADAVIPISSRMGAELVAAGTCHPGRVHPYGMGVTRDILEVGDPPTRSTGSELRLVYVGTLVARRRIERLVEAIGIAVEKHGVDAHLTVLGGTPDEAIALRARTEQLGLASRVRIAGTIARKDVYREMVQHHAGAIFIARDPRFRVASTTKMIESLAVGLPCVATDAVDMHAEFVDNGEAVLVTDDSAAGFAAGIARLDAEWSTHVERARSRRHAVYEANSYEGARRTMEDLIVQLVGDDASRSSR